MIEKVDRALGVAGGAAAMALVSDDVGWSERKRRLECIESKPKRFAAIAIQNVVKTSPKLARDMLTRPYEKRGLEVVGMGYCSTVIRMGNSVLKLLRGTDRLSETNQLECVQRLESTQSILLDYMSDFALPQEFEIIEHPFKPRDIVVAKQPFVEGFIPLRINRLDGFANLSEQQKATVDGFVKQAHKMVDESGWAPDVLGTDNFGFTEDYGPFVIVDTIPTMVTIPPDLSVEYLNRIATAVQQS
jgi:hypothetical protein